MLAAIEGKSQALQALLAWSDLRARCPVSGKAPLEFAALNGQGPCAEILLDALGEAPPLSTMLLCVQSRLPLHEPRPIAIAKRRAHCLGLLLSRAAPLSPDWLAPLLEASLEAKSWLSLGELAKAWPQRFGEATRDRPSILAEWTQDLEGSRAGGEELLIFCETHFDLPGPRRWPALAQMVQDMLLANGDAPNAQTLRHRCALRAERDALAQAAAAAPAKSAPRHL